MAAFSILTYNIHFNKALADVLQIIDLQSPDIICLQEFEINESSLQKIEEKNYLLADFSYSFYKFFRFFGLVTFYKKDIFSYQNSRKISLSRSFYEFIIFLTGFGKCTRSALHCDLRHLSSRKTLAVYNLHLTALQASNKVRDKQLQKIVAVVKKENPNPILILGDFNYAYRRRNLEKQFTEHGFSEATGKIEYTCEEKILGLFHLRVKMDYILFKNLILQKTEAINRLTSDHLPILSYFSFSA